jgi:excisionase family DNA binding protein
MQNRDQSPRQDGQREAVRVKEFSEEYGLSLGAVYGHISRGNLSVIRLGRTILIPRDALQRERTRK